jgi:FkbM family methyltransferase
MVRIVGTGGNIYAFELIPSMYKDLKVQAEATSMQNILHVYPYALSNSNDSTDFCLAVDTPAYSGILERVYDTQTQVEHINVESRKLDDVISDENISYTKIDTEGAEWNVIQGASDLIKRCRPYISFEFGESYYRNYKVDPIEVFDFFKMINYELFDINGKKMSREFFPVSSVQQSVWDYIAAPEENAKSTFAILGKI